MYRQEPELDLPRAADADWDTERLSMVEQSLAGCGGGAICRALLRTARWHAQQVGIAPDLAEDCGIEFVEKMLLLERRLAGSGRAVPYKSAAWVRRCARNHALKFLRHLAACGPGTGVEVELPGSEPKGADAALPEREMLRQEFWFAIAAALQRLPSAQRTLLTAYHITGEPVASIAIRLGTTEASIRQSLCRARRQVRSTLERMGMTEDELRGLLGE